MEGQEGETNEYQIVRNALNLLIDTTLRCITYSVWSSNRKQTVLL